MDGADAQLQPAAQQRRPCLGLPSVLTSLGLPSACRAPQHPGGAQNIYKIAGTDATTIFSNQHGAGRTLRTGAGVRFAVGGRRGRRCSPGACRPLHACLLLQSMLPRRHPVQPVHDFGDVLCRRPGLMALGCVSPTMMAANDAARNRCVRSRSAASRRRCACYYTATSEILLMLYFGSRQSSGPTSHPHQTQTDPPFHAIVLHMHTPTTPNSACPATGGALIIWCPASVAARAYDGGVDSGSHAHRHARRRRRLQQNRDRCVHR